ncbi:MAG: hypothetical protein ABJN69_17210 [Hellea sp.]
MGPQNRISTANDNAPARPARLMRGDGSVSYPAVNERPSPPPSNPIPDLITLNSNDSAAETATGSLKLSLICWATALIMMLSAFFFEAGAGLKVLSSLTLLWAGLWGSYVCADHGRWRLSEVSVVTALVGLMGAIFTSASFLGLGLTLTDGLLLMSITPLPIGYILKSRICVMASICASLLWAALSFTGLIEYSNIMLLFPAILAVQIFTATKVQSGMAMALAVLTGYYWLGSFIFANWSADNLPLTFAAAVIFVIGTAHHRSGKAAEDKEIAGSSIHIYTGWVAAIVGAIGFQYFWLSPDALQNSAASLSPEGLGLWKGLTLGALAVIFCSAIIRYKYSQITLAGIFLVTAVSALIPMMLWFPAWTQKMVAAIPGISAVPAAGILIGAGILAASLGMILNGIRRHSPIMMGLGITAILAQAYLLIKPELMTLDHVVIFGAGLLASLAIGAAIAGSSLAHQAPAPRLKHA